MSSDLLQLLATQGWIVDQPSNANLSIAEGAFSKAFAQKLGTGDDELLAKWQQSSKIEDVLSSVKDSERKYRQRGNGKVWKWATRLSSKIMFYSNVLDVIAQHHPEYVALAWGTIKFLLVVVINYETMIKELCKALCRIGDALQHVRLNLLLYPTKAMQEQAEKLYAQIIEFAIRAIKWYQKSASRQCLAVVCNPFQLKFRDIVDEIQEASRGICELALSMSQVEIRQMRLEVAQTRLEMSATRKIAEEVKLALNEYSQLHYAGIIDTNKRITQVQLSQILTFVSDSPLPDPETTQQCYTSRRNLRRRVPRPPLDPSRFQEWGASKESAQIMVVGGFRNRHLVRDCAIDLIDLITEADVPVVWVLEPDRQPDADFTSVAVLKYMVSQILKLNQIMMNERSATLNAARFQTATTEEEWFSLLGAALEGLRQLYMIIDVELLHKCVIPPTYWLAKFSRLFQTLRTRGLQTLLKIAFIHPLGAKEAWLGEASECITLNLLSRPSNRDQGDPRSKRITGRRGQRKLISGFLCKRHN